MNHLLDAERRKIERRIRRLEKQQRALAEHSSEESTQQLATLSDQLIQLKEDLEYVRVCVPFFTRKQILVAALSVVNIMLYIQPLLHRIVLHHTLGALDGFDYWDSLRRIGAREGSLSTGSCSLLALSFLPIV